MSKFVSRFMKDESGATAIEYGLIAALIAVVIVTAVTTIGTKLNTKFNSDRRLRSTKPRFPNESVGEGRGVTSVAALAFER